jgi:hypothetical protein
VGGVTPGGAPRWRAAFGRRALGQRQHAVIVAVAAVGMVQPRVDEIVDVVAVWNRLMAALRSMLMIGRVPFGVCRWCALRRVLAVDGDLVLVDVIGVRMMQMPVM